MSHCLPDTETSHARWSLTPRTPVHRFSILNLHNLHHTSVSRSRFLVPQQLLSDLAKKRRTGEVRNRTKDLFKYHNANETLYQLSYIPNYVIFLRTVLITITTHIVSQLVELETR